MSYPKIIFLIYIAYLIVMSLISMSLFIKDKKMAVKNHSEVRIKEKTLLGLCCFGGALGGFIGRLVAHHKTNKIYFSLVIYFSLLLQILALCAIAYFAFF